MKLLLWIIALLNPYFQFAVPTRTSALNTVTTTFGNAMQTKTDNGNANYLIANPFRTLGVSTQFQGCNVWWGTPQAATWGCALYSDSGGGGGPASLLCQNTTGTTPASGFNSMAITGCPNPLGLNTVYWLTEITGSNTQQQGKSKQSMDCDPQGDLRAVATAAQGSTTFPGTFPAFTLGGDGCETLFAKLSYQAQTKPFTIYSADFGNADTLAASYTLGVAPAQANESWKVLLYTFSTSSVTLSSLSDPAGDTFALNGSCSSSSGFTICAGSADRVTAGQSSITINLSGTPAYAASFGVIHCLGCKASGSYDQQATNSALLATPFTGNNTPTTTAANELLIGMAVNTITTGAYAEGKFTAGTNWNLLNSSGDAGATSTHAIGFFYRIVTSTGAYNLSGSFATSGTNNLPFLVTYQ